MPRAKKAPRQQTLEATLGQPRLRAPLKTPRSSASKDKAKGSSTQPSSSPAPVRSSPRISSSFMPTPSFKKRQVLVVKSSSSSSEEESGDELAAVLPSPAKRRSTRRRGAERDDSSTLSVPSPPSPPVVKVEEKEEEEEDDSDDDKPLVMPSSTLRKQFRNRQLDESDEDKPLVMPSSALRQQSRKRQLVLDDSDDDDDIIISSPVKRRRLIRRNESSPVRSGGDEEEPPTPRPTSARKAARRPRTEKEKARELLRRKRAGETIEEEDEEEEEEVQPVKAVYDTDSDNPVLKDFEDDDEGIPEPAAQPASSGKSRSPRKSKKRERTPASDSDSDVVDLGEDGAASDQDQGQEEDMDDFVVDDGDAPLGVPDDVLHEIPLQFTQHSHKPLKEHFRDVVEWLVLFKINPGFPEQRHELYMMAWKKLDDEVRGLAQSKFASSAWRKDFYMALRARPYYTNVELPKGEAFDEFENCGACGRRGHPARWSIQFSGPAYSKTATAENFLLPIESSNSDSDSSTSSSQQSNDEDEDGNPIPKESKRWLIGSVCNSNAETAHNLIHWKHALLDWVDATLEKDGYMAPDKLKARLKMRPKKKYKLVDQILETWTAKGIIRALYRDFRGTIEEARNKTTTGRFGRR
ncbi:hypothetical protein B0T19DRAFT_144724 [Cercophora scortea]|uniref:DUF4211 domain-containing protein n=1 Tax=Cercophora scortea TaxID=314031 RepID=A0AAE0MK46_9PEZI|nr:hypothetical protein B0T19DRAFT_144724 [Cercophora scortea]